MVTSKVFLKSFLTDKIVSSVETAIERFKAGKMVIIVDDENRENEGDLAVLAESVTKEDINFMASKGRGLICTPMSKEYIDRLNLPMMTSHNNDPMKTAFTVSVDASHGITTGISASDRAHTIQLLASDNASGLDFSSPGHVFPLKAQDGGVLVRTGQTEGSVDLAKLAGKKPAAVICEIMNPDGTMARMPELAKISQEHDIPILSIADLITYRASKESMIEKITSANLPTKFGEFKLFAYKSAVDYQEHLVLVKGDIDPKKPTLVRVHSECFTGDVFGSSRCECGQQLDSALSQISKENGVLVYMRQEGRGIGLVNKIKAYHLQDSDGLDTVDANIKLGFDADLRHYGVGAQILRDLGVVKFNLLTNNPKKVVGLRGFGLDLVEVRPLIIESNKHNKSYLETKKTKLGHNI